MKANPQADTVDVANQFGHNALSTLYDMQNAEIIRREYFGVRTYFTILKQNL